ncbi:hypothetical protein [Salinicoccus albus]|uniref:hypothetical protein n=1 Tax=Salinicoccus albus TaxID=418756 RepID=UPI000373BF0B|nr:hypothetical protein [Salinicoccus albus]
MKILVAGGIYINDNTADIHPVGGFKIAQLIGTHSHHDVHLHTNFSTEENRISKAVKQSLRANGVSPKFSGKVSEGYGRLYRDDFISGSNLFETVKADSRLQKQMMAFDMFILTTDIAERDFRYLLAFARNNNIETHVFTCGEYPSRHQNVRTHEHTLHDVASGPPRPVYHEHLDDIRAILTGYGVIAQAPVEREADELPKSPLFDSGGFLLQFVGLALAALVIVGGGIFLLQSLTAQDAVYETDIDMGAAVDHEDCGTVQECKDLGDQYLAELDQYIDIQDEPDVFIENRTRNNLITYEVENFELTDPEYHNELPVGTEAEFVEIWEMFQRVIPNERITSVRSFNLFSDGEGNTLAYVDIQPEGTTLGVDIRDNSSRASQYRTLIHEYGHIHSLPAGDFTEGCGGTELDCLQDGTLMAAYIDRFWAQYGEEWIENKHKSQPEQEAFYNNNVNDFEVPYAALNPKEDYAVTFVSFITAPMPEDSSQLNDTKVMSFYEDPELVALRVDILNNLLAYEKERASDES